MNKKINVFKKGDNDLEINVNEPISDEVFMSVKSIDNDINITKKKLTRISKYLMVAKEKCSACKEDLKNLSKKKNKYEFNKKEFQLKKKLIQLKFHKNLITANAEGWKERIKCLKVMKLLKLRDQ
jgi:hypothetical protein